jgi:exonuclease SbcD
MAAIRFIHSADWHLGKSLHEHALLEDQRKVLWDLIRLIEEENPDFLVVAGDVFDRSVPSAEALALLGDFLSALRKISPIPLVFLGGNHDSPSRLSYGAELFAHQAIFFRSLPRGFTQPVELDIEGQGVQIWCLPFLRKYDLGPEDWALGEEDAQPSLFDDPGHARGQGGDPAEEQVMEQAEDSPYYHALEKIRRLANPDARQILVAHLFTLGGQASDSERPLVGGLGEVPVQWLKGFEYVALGHLHRPQEPQPGVVYSGSPLAYSFSEAADQKVWQIVQLGDHPGAAPKIQARKIQPLRPVRRVSAPLKELLDSEDYAPLVEAYLEITLEQESIRPGIMTLLRGRFPFLLSLRQRQEEELGEDLRPGSWEARDFLGDFRAFWNFHYGEDPQGELEEQFSDLLEPPESQPSGVNSTPPGELT